MAREKMLAHAEHWIAAWNRRDVEAVLRAFAASAGFISPKATDLGLEGTSRLQGKPPSVITGDARWRTLAGWSFGSIM